MKQVTSVLTLFFCLLSLSAFAQESSSKEIGVGVSNLFSANPVGIIYRKHNEKSSFRLRANPNINFSTTEQGDRNSFGTGTSLFIGKQRNVDLGKKLSIYYGADAYLLFGYNRASTSQASHDFLIITEEIRTSKNYSFGGGPMALGGLTWKFHDRLALSVETHLGLVFQGNVTENKTQTIRSNMDGHVISDREESITNENYAASLRWISPTVFLGYFF